MRKMMVLYSLTILVISACLADIFGSRISPEDDQSYDWDLDSDWMERLSRQTSDCACPKNLEPVCGYRGGKWRTFDNGCIAVCSQAKSIEVGSCKHKKQASFARGPVVRSSRQSTEEDSTCICPQYYDPVCGSDGHNYDNEDCAKCFGVEKTTPGFCDSSRPIRKRSLTHCVCEPLLEPACGSDGLDYANADCAEKCGLQMKTKRGRCEEACPQCKPYVNMYAPVCDTRRIFYVNGCYAECFSAEGALTNAPGFFC